MLFITDEEITRRLCFLKNTLNEQLPEKASVLVMEFIEEIVSMVKEKTLQEGYEDELIKCNKIISDISKKKIFSIVEGKETNSLEDKIKVLLQ